LSVYIYIREFKFVIIQLREILAEAVFRIKWW